MRLVLWRQGGDPRRETAARPTRALVWRRRQRWDARGRTSISGFSYPKCFNTSTISKTVGYSQQCAIGIFRPLAVDIFELM